MNKKIGAFILSALTMIGLSSCTLKERDTYEVTVDIDIPPKMLFLGDSIAAGYGLEGYDASDLYKCQSYPNILAEKYTAELDGKCQHQMVNKAVSGQTSKELLDQILSGELDKDLADSDAIVISIGGNDMLGILLDVLASAGVSEDGEFNIKDFSLFGAAASLYTMGGRIDIALVDFEENLKKIAAELNSRTEGEIWFQTLYDPIEYYSDIQIAVDFSNEKLDTFNTIIHEHASDPDGSYHVAEVASRFRGENGKLTNIPNFDIHPNAEGHVVISEVIDNAFRQQGFSYQTTEQGEEHYTEEAIWMFRLCGAAAVLIILFIILFIVGRNKKAD